MDDHKQEPIVEWFRVWLVKVDIVFHIVAALLLLIACTLILYYAVVNVLTPSSSLC